MAPDPTPARLPREWRCFQCDQVFTDELEARIHFAADGPACMRSEPVLLGHLHRATHNLEVSQSEVKRLQEELTELDSTARELLNNARARLAEKVGEVDHLRQALQQLREAKFS